MTGSQKTRSAAERVAAQLIAWPGLESGRASCGIGTAYQYDGTQILHLHTGEAADLRLTRPFIERLDQVLTESGQVLTRHDDDWVTVPLNTDSDGSLLISLLSLAIRAIGEPAAPCGRGRRRRLLPGHR